MTKTTRPCEVSEHWTLRICQYVSGKSGFGFRIWETGSRWRCAECDPDPGTQFCGIDREFVSVSLRQIIAVTKQQLSNCFMENNSTPSSSALPRRDFLKKTATAAAAVAATPLLRTPVYGQDQAPVGERGRGQ